MSRFKAFSIVIHIAGWLLFMALPLVFLNGRGHDNTTWLLFTQPYYWLFCLTYIFLFYINANLFIPKLFLKKKYLAYSIITLLLLTCIYYLKPFDRLLRSSETFPRVKEQQSLRPPLNQHDPDGPPPPFKPGHHHGPPLDIASLFIFLMIVAISTAIKTIQQLQLTEQRITRAEADKTTAELSSLKAQINPHFLFNTLNNIYTLVITQDDNAAESVMKLSNIMRYVTEDVTADFVPLQSELNCINDYIELQRLRMGKNTEVHFSLHGHTTGKKIAPLVLMTFVENVFKYGISNHQKSVISIKVDTNDKHIAFFCKNRIFNSHEENQSTGIGIKNTKQRLAHLYPGKHLLNISNQDGYYTVRLSLQN
jgi:two-component system LytT family sensor kinase